MILAMEFGRAAQISRYHMQYIHAEEANSFLFKFAQRRNCSTTCQQELRIFPFSLMGHFFAFPDSNPVLLPYALNDQSSIISWLCFSMGHEHGPWLVACVRVAGNQGVGHHRRLRLAGPLEAAPLQCNSGQGNICPLTAPGGASVHC